MRSRLAGLVVAVVVAVSLAAMPPASGDISGAPPPWLVIEDGETQPVFSLDDAIEESVFVETEVDSDGDGRRDRVHLTLSRPGETETDGIDVPVIFEHSPYRFGTGGLPNHNVDFDVLPQEFIQPGGSGIPPVAAGNTLTAQRTRQVPDLPGSLDNYWVPRGYAVVLGESIGTAHSDGCPTIGDQAETLGTKAIIDWLNGRARAWNDAGEPVQADWTTGEVGMTGVSYNGTLPNMAATTGVEGLETIVPVSAIASWYDYYRANGLVVAPHSERSGVGENAFQGEDMDILAFFTEGDARLERCRHVTDRLAQFQDRVTGDFSDFWRARDYVRRAGGVEASVFVVHGLEDWNVRTKAFASWWGALAENQVPRKIWLHNGGHGGPGGAGAEGFQRTLNRWMGHWLYGIDNGIMDEPSATVQRPDSTHEQYADWPVPGAVPTTLHLGAPNATEPGTLTLTPPRGPRPWQGFVDRGRELDVEADLIRNPDQAHPNRLVYLTPELASPMQLSGTPELTLRASIDDRYAANLTAVLVDYGPTGSVDPPVMVTSGWMDPQNRTSLRRSRPLQQGMEYTFGWDLQPDDYVFATGHRIGLVVVSTDFDHTLRPLPGTHLTVHPANSQLSLPLASH
ncbi:MAG: Xaa-Pro dipeptidyl-peptidase [Acidimicrobiales bacterium]